MKKLAKIRSAGMGVMVDLYDEVNSEAEIQAKVWLVEKIKELNKKN